jgi:rhodanese-related sulfurtransferase/DNA-binding transcriptional ArsR family regulator
VLTVPVEYNNSIDYLNINSTEQGPDRRFKDDIFEQFARIGKAVASAKRIELLDLLSQGERHVEALAEAIGTSVANTSQHLQVLRASRLVETEKSGVFVTYRLSDRSVADFVRQLRMLAENRLAEVEQTTRNFIEGRIGFEPVNREVLLRRVRKGEVTVLDVRPAEEFCAGHLPRALSVPMEDLEARMKDFSKDREIVAYCRGPYCVMSVEAVARLREQGFHAVRLDMGVVDWQARGLPVEQGRGGKPGALRNSRKRIGRMNI